MKIRLLALILLLVANTAPAQPKCTTLSQRRLDGFSDNVRSVTKIEGLVKKVENTYQPFAFRTTTTTTYSEAGDLLYTDLRLFLEDNTTFEGTYLIQHQKGSRPNYAMAGDTVTVISLSVWENDTTHVIREFTRSGTLFSLTKIVQETYNANCARLYVETIDYDPIAKKWKPKEIGYDHRNATDEELEILARHQALAELYLIDGILKSTDPFGNPTLMLEESPDNIFRVSYSYTYYK